jgi:hypothetical protein
MGLIYIMVYFGCYVIDNDPGLFEKMAKWFWFRYTTNERGYPYEDYDYAVEKQFWSTFEERLREVDETPIIDTYESDLGLEVEDYDIPIEDDLLVDRIRKAFIQWIS